MWITITSLIYHKPSKGIGYYPVVIVDDDGTTFPDARLYRDSWRGSDVYPQFDVAFLDERFDEYDDAWSRACEVSRRIRGRRTEA